MANSKSPSMAEYNPIFELLVDNKDDVITGYVAYALYKQKKRDWITDFRSRQGCAPTDKDLDEYTRIEALPRNIVSLQREARAILSEYASAVTEAQYEELRRRALDDTVIAEVKSTLSNIEENSSLWSQIKIACAFTIITTLEHFHIEC